MQNKPLVSVGQASLRRRVGVLAGVGDLPLWGCRAGWRGWLSACLEGMMDEMEVFIEYSISC